MMPAMRIVITGGAGFLGSHLGDLFLARGASVVAVDNLVTGDRRNIAHHAGNARFEFIEHDVSRPIEIAGPVGAVLHFASPASPPDYLRLKIQTLKVNALGTLNALGLAKAKGARFLLASTSEVYGDPLVHPQPESYWGNVNPVGPRGVYDEGKRFAEALAMAYHQTHGLATRIVRIFNTFGPRMRANDGRAVCTFIAQALEGRDITVHGDGLQTRSFCYVSDLVEGIARLLDSDETMPVNIGNPEEITVLQLAREIIELTKSPSRIVFTPRMQDDPAQRRPDIARAKAILKWEPVVPRRDGLRRTIEYVRGPVGTHLA
jgi:dTDP-glucose 4,6-dehydratase